MTYTAYANSADGTKDFTKVRPKPNLYNSSLLNSDPSIIVEETGFKLLGSWAKTVIDHANLWKILRVGHTYHFSYDFELLTLQEGTVPYNQPQHTTLLLYSGKDIRNYPIIGLTQYINSDNIELANNLRVGDIVHHTKSVTIPECAGDVFADYRILAYGRRSMNPDGTLNRMEDGRFMNIKIEDSQTGETVYLQNAIDNLGKSYMRYIGTSNTDSNNPSDYTWKLNLVGEARHTITPENATVKDVTYSVADKSVVTITQNDDHTGVLLSPESYGKTILTAKTVDSGKIANLTVNTIKTLNLDHSNRISLSPVGDAHKILTDIRNSGTVNLLKGTGDASSARVYSVRSNNESILPTTYEDIVESDRLAYTRVRRAKLADGTWGSKSFSLYMLGAPVEQWATEDFIGTGYWFSFMVRSNIALTISKSAGTSVREFTGGTDYGRADIPEDVPLEADKWKMIKVWVPESEESARLATNIRFLLATPNLTNTQLATASLDVSRPMVSKEEPYYWLPAPEDVGVPHGQPNLANNTFKDWKSYTFTYWRPDDMLRSINPVDLGLSVGDVLTVKSEIKNPADSNVKLAVEISQMHEGVRTAGTPNEIISGTSGTSVASFTVKNLENPIKVGEIVKSDLSTTVTGAQARRLKLIKGDKTLMDFWTPSFADFSAGKYPLNPYFEVAQENYSKLTTTAELTNTTKIIGTKAETQIVFDTVNTVRDYFPREFSGLTTNESILVKFATIVKSIKVVIPFKGVSSTRTYAERGIISNTGEYNGISTNVTTNLDSREHVLTSNYAPYIQQDMTMKYFVCTDATNGLVASSVTVGKPVQTVIVQPSENPNGEAVEITVSPKV